MKKLLILSSFVMVLGSSLCHCAAERVRPAIGEELQKKLDEALILATIEGNLQIFDGLIDLGANINAANNVGMTPLMSAALFGRIDFVQRLLDRGVDKTVANRAGGTALAMARSQGYDAIVALLDPEELKRAQEQRIQQEQKRAGLQRLTEGSQAQRQVETEVERRLKLEKDFVDAATRDDTKKMEELVQLGLSKDDALISAAKAGDVNAVRNLLNAGANIDAVDVLGRTALISASIRKRGTDVVKLLLEKGARTDIRDTASTNRTALEWAEFKKHDDIVKLLKGHQER